MSESERDELLRRKAELEERIAFLESEQHGGGLAAVKAEGARIVFEHEQRLAREPIRPLAPGEYLSPDPLAHLRPPRESQGESVTAVARAGAAG